MQLGNAKIEIEGNIFKAEFKEPFIPPSKLEEKDKYKPFKGEIEVEPSRLFLLYENLNNALKGDFLDKIFVLRGDTIGKKAIIITPPSLLSENAKNRGGVYGIKFEDRDENEIKSGRVIVSLSLLNALKNKLKEEAKMQISFVDIDEEGRHHILIMERNKEGIKIVYPIEAKFTELKRSKLEVALNMFKEGSDKVPTTILQSKAVFRKNNKGNFVFHSPHHSVRFKPEDIDKLLLFIQK